MPGLILNNLWRCAIVILVVVSFGRESNASAVSLNRNAVIERIADGAYGISCTYNVNLYGATVGQYTPGNALLSRIPPNPSTVISPLIYLTGDTIYFGPNSGNDKDTMTAMDGTVEADLFAAAWYLAVFDYGASG